MTILEVMERTGMKETSLAIAFIKDALNLIQSNSKDILSTSTWNIIKSTTSTDNKFILPNSVVSIENVSVKDTSADRYKKIKRLTDEPPYLIEDLSP